MVPYSNFYYFYLMFLILIPAVVLGLLGKKIKYYGLIATIAILFLVFHNSGVQAGFLIFFYILQMSVSYLYLWLRKNYKKTWLFWIMLLISASPMLATKIGGFIHISNLGFLGISYLSFKSMQVIIQIHDGHIKKLPFIDFTYFILFFPTFTSGPIDRSKRFFEDINKKYTTKEYLNLLGEGLWKLLIGLGYKFVIADVIYNYFMVNIVSHDAVNTIKYMYVYSLYLFFDFAGYSLIAIGVSYILAVKTPENFNLPFISEDIKDFWNRWHMSLSFWFRDFIYTKFVTTAIRKKWFKYKPLASYLGYFITMTTMGLWHGLELNYIVYGLYHGVLLASTDIYQKNEFYKKHKNKPIYKVISTFITINLVCFGFLIFSGFMFK